MVSEAGASVYSASAYASQELPELDVSLRGAVSIARRLQDPLAELVKIDPKSIGVGQYQHDLSEFKLVALARCRRRGLRERGRRRREHRLRAAARARVGPRRVGGAEHRLAPQPERPLPEPRKALKHVAGSGPKTFELSRRLPAHPRTATIRSTPPACTRRPIRWCGAS